MKNMKITLPIPGSWRSLWRGRHLRVVHIRILKDGSWSKYSERDLLSAMRDMKGIEIEEAEKSKVAQHPA